MPEPISISIAIAYLVKSAPGWFHSLEDAILGKGKELAFDQGKQRISSFLDEKEHLRHVEVALKNAAERGLKNFLTTQERDTYRDILKILSESASEPLRHEAMQLISLSDNPDLTLLAEKYNLRQRISALAQQKVHKEVDVAPYLRSFFEALIVELYNDPLFREQMSDILKVRAALQGQRSLAEIVTILSNISKSMAKGYTLQQFNQEVKAYIEFVEGIFRYHEFAGIALKGDEDTAPELGSIFVPLHITVQNQTFTGSAAQNDIISLLESNPYLVLLGGPGSGKSTITRYLAWCHAIANQASSSLPFAKNISLLSGKPIPLRIELRRFTDARRQHPAYSFLTYATDILLPQENISLHPLMFNELLDRRLMLLLFDGLDEVPTLAERKQLISEIQHFASRYPGNRIVVTSRPVGYEVASFPNRWFSHYTIQEFNDEQIHAFLESWYTHVLKHPSLSSDLKKELETFYAALKNNARLYKLATNPLLLTVMAAIHRSERLPDKRVQVYERCADLLLDTWAKLKGNDDRGKEMKMGSKDDQSACLAYLGFILHERSQEKGKNTPNNEDDEDTLDNEDESDKQMKGDVATDVSSDFIRKEIAHYIKDQQLLLSGAEQNTEAQRFLDLIKIEAGLIVERGTDEDGKALYGFIHRTFQEYFAAAHIHNRFEEDGAEVISTFLRQHLHDPHWHEVILLLFGKLRRKPATAQLVQILAGNSPLSEYRPVLQHDLFFVCECLAEGISVESTFAERTISGIYDLIHKSPFPTQRMEALEVFRKLLQTQQYAQLCQQKLKILMRERGILDIIDQILEAIKPLYLTSLSGSEEEQPALQILLALAQRSDLSPEQALQVSETICRCSPIHAEELRRGSSLLLAFIQRPDFSLEQILRGTEILYLTNPAGSEEELQVTQFLLALAQGSGLSPVQRLQVEQVLYWYSPNDSENRKQSAQFISAFPQRSDLSLEQMLQVPEIVSSDTHAGEEIATWGAQFLFSFALHADLSPEQMLQVVKVLHQYPYINSDIIRGLAYEQLFALAQRSDLSFEQIIELLDLSPDDSEVDERLLSLIQNFDFSPKQARQVLKSFPLELGSSTIPPQYERLSSLAQRSDPLHQGMLKLLEQFSFDGEDITQPFGWLFALAQRSDLSFEQMLQVLSLLRESIEAGDDMTRPSGWVVDLAQRSDLSPEQMLQVIPLLNQYKSHFRYWDMPSLSLVYGRVLDMAQHSDLSPEQMLQVLSLLNHYTPYYEEWVLSLAQRSDLSPEQISHLTTLISQYGDFGESGNQFVFQIANQERVLTIIRDRMYRILRARVLDIKDLKTDDEDKYSFDL